MPNIPLSPAHAIRFALLGLALAFAGCASREERIQNIQAKADDALTREMPAEAQEVLAKGLRKYPDSNVIRLYLSRVESNLGNYPRAIELLQDAVAQEPDNDGVWVRIGELQAKTGNSAAAIEAFQNYLKNHGDDFLAQKALAIELEKSGRLTDAIKAATKWNQVSPAAEPAFMIGRLYLASNNIPQARSWFGQAAAYQNEPAAKEALAELIRLELGVKQFQQAEVWLQTYQQNYGAVTSDPRIREAVQVLDSMRKAREELERTALAMEEERRRLEEEQLAKQKAAEKERLEREAAERAAAELAAANPSDQPAEEPADSADDEQLGGRVRLFDDSNATSSQQAKPAADRNGDLAALSKRDEAILAFRSGDMDSAITQFSSLLGDNPNDVELWTLLARAYYAKQQWFDAEAYVLEARRRDPRDPAIANLYLNVILKTQSPVQAIEEIKANRQLFPNDPAIALTLARALRNANAAPSLVANAYQGYLALASRNDPGYNEAAAYLRNGR